jgi:hypothetical protein
MAQGQHKCMKKNNSALSEYVKLRLAACSFIISGGFFDVKNCVVTCEPHPVFENFLY